MTLLPIHYTDALFLYYLLTFRSHRVIEILRGSNFKKIDKIQIILFISAAPEAPKDIQLLLGLMKLIKSTHHKKITHF